MKKLDILNQEIFQKLWENRKDNLKFQQFLACFEIDWKKMELVDDKKYVLLYHKEAEEYMVFLSKRHPLDSDFLKRQEKLSIKKLRILFVKE